jgi:hypothetical protein
MLYPGDYSQKCSNFAAIQTVDKLNAYEKGNHHQQPY